MAPLLAGVGCGALVAVLVTVAGWSGPKPDPQPDPLAATNVAPQALAIQPADPAPAAQPDGAPQPAAAPQPGAAPQPAVVPPAGTAPGVAAMPGAAPQPGVAPQPAPGAAPVPQPGAVAGAAPQPGAVPQPGPAGTPMAVGAQPGLPIVPNPQPKPPKPTKPAEPQQSGKGGQVVAITNAQRAKAGCKPLRVDSRLTRAALRHSQNMANKGFFNHNDPSGDNFEDREIAAGFPADKTGGENIARGQKDAKTVMRDWMGSPSHRKNILNCEFTTIGVGYVADGNHWTQNFGY